MNEPLVSVIIPIYNTELIRFCQCVDSIRGQSLTDFEVICIDDGSREELTSQYRELLCQDDRFFLYTKQNGGVSSARNEGLRRARGKYLAFVDSDDTISSGYLAALVEMAEHHELDMSIGVLCKVPFGAPLVESESAAEDGDCIGIDIQDLKSCILTRGKRSYNTTGLAFPGSKLIRRSCAQGITFDETLSIGEDLLYVLRVLDKCRTVGISHGAVYLYSVQEDSAMRRYREDGFSVSERLLVRFLQYQDCLGLSAEDIGVRAVYQFVLASRQAVFHPMAQKGLLQKAAVCRQIYSGSMWERLISHTGYGKLNIKNKLVLFLLKNRLFLLYAILLTLT